MKPLYSWAFVSEDRNSSFESYPSVLAALEHATGFKMICNYRGPHRGSITTMTADTYIIADTYPQLEELCRKLALKCIDDWKAPPIVIRWLEMGILDSELSTFFNGPTTATLPPAEACARATFQVSVNRFHLAVFPAITQYLAVKAARRNVAFEEAFGDWLLRR